MSLSDFPIISFLFLKPSLQEKDRPKCSKMLCSEVFSEINIAKHDKCRKPTDRLLEPKQATVFRSKISQFPCVSKLRCLGTRCMFRNYSNCHRFTAISRPKTVRIAVQALLFNTFKIGFKLRCLEHPLGEYGPLGVRRSQEIRGV